MKLIPKMTITNKMTQLKSRRKLEKNLTAALFRIQTVRRVESQFVFSFAETTATHELFFQENANKIEKLIFQSLSVLEKYVILTATVVLNTKS